MADLKDLQYKHQNSKFKAIYLKYYCEKLRRKEFLFTEILVILTIASMIALMLAEEYIYIWIGSGIGIQIFLLFRLLVVSNIKLREMNDLQVLYELQHLEYSNALETFKRNDPYNDLDTYIRSIEEKERLRFERLKWHKQRQDDSIREKAKTELLQYLEGLNMQLISGDYNDPQEIIPGLFRMA